MRLARRRGLLDLRVSNKASGRLVRGDLADRYFGLWLISILKIEPILTSSDFCEFFPVSIWNMYDTEVHVRSIARASCYALHVDGGQAERGQSLQVCQQKYEELKLRDFCACH